MLRRILTAAVWIFGIIGCSSSGETGIKAGNGSVPTTGGANGAGGVPGTQCKTSADCPQTDCFGCAGTVCLNGQCVPAVVGGSGSGGVVGGGGASGGSGSGTGARLSTGGRAGFDGGASGASASGGRASGGAAGAGAAGIAGGTPCGTSGTVCSGGKKCLCCPANPAECLCSTACTMASDCTEAGMEACVPASGTGRFCGPAAYCMHP
jgi:hypothetical protein